MIDLIQNLDASALLYIQEHLRMAFLNPIMAFFSLLGNSGLVWIALGLILLIPQKTRRHGFEMLICLLVAYLINDWVIKILVERPRPYTVIEGLTILVAPLKSFSFPSGHTNSSFAAAMALTLAFGRKGAYAYILAVLIALSRCYVGVHYPSDVVAGAIVGTLVSLATYKLLQRYLKTDFIPKKKA